MNQEQFSTFLISALTNDEGAAAFRKALKPLIDEQTTQTQQVLKALTEKVESQEERIQNMECEVDLLKQHGRNKTLVITGIV